MKMQRLRGGSEPEANQEQNLDEPNHEEISDEDNDSNEEAEYSDEEPENLSDDELDSDEDSHDRIESNEDLEKPARENKSRGLDKRIGKLTAKAKSAEEEAARLAQELKSLRS